MSKAIKISPKHGVNPCIPQCFYCGESKNEIALLGRIGGKKDLEAPKNMVLDYEPCEKCAENMSLGVTLIEVSDVQPDDNRPPMKAQGEQLVYPLGRWCVIRPEAFSAMTNTEWQAGQKCFVDSQLMTMINNDNN